MEIRDKIFIDGSWVKPGSDNLIELSNSANGEVFAKVASGTKEDVDKAVLAAQKAFKEWSLTSREERAKYLQKITETLQARMTELAQVITKEVGTPLSLSQLIQVGLPISTFSSMVQLISEEEKDETIGNSLIVRQPKGVVAAITPWNYPMHQGAAKIAPALAAGCTVVYKPAGYTALDAFLLAEVMEEAGLPPGVFNLVTGPGSEIGEALASHPGVDFISFTGSTEVGKRIAELASKTIKRVALELGGKSATVILEDADISSAVSGGLFMCYLNSGQTCIAETRMLVPESKLDEVEEKVISETQSYTVGDPFEMTTRVGPLVSRSQVERVKEYIKIGQDEGAKLIIGGTDSPPGLENGYYVKPTVFSNVKNSMRIAQEEIFGPVLSIIPYKSESEAVEIANDSIYGLSGSVWAGDKNHAIEVAKKIRTGQVSVNGGAFNASAPFGGFKQSGYGRELGKYGLEEFYEIQSLQL